MKFRKKTKTKKMIIRIRNQRMSEFNLRFYIYRKQKQRIEVA